MRSILVPLMLSAVSFAKYVPAQAEIDRCGSYLVEQCGKVEKKGADCVVCVKAAIKGVGSSASEKNRASDKSVFFCSEETLEKFCYAPRANPITSDVESISCEDHVKTHCGEFALKGLDCQKCILANLADINRGLAADCTNFQLNHFCFLMNDEKVEDPSTAGIEELVHKPVITLLGMNPIHYIAPEQPRPGENFIRLFDDPGAKCTEADCDPTIKQCEQYPCFPDIPDVNPSGKHEIVYTCKNNDNVAAEPVVRTVLTGPARELAKTGEDACTSEDVQLFCASSTKAYEFLKSDHSFETAEAVCFPQLEQASICKVRETDMHRAFMESPRVGAPSYKWQVGEQLNMHLLLNCGNCLASTLNIVAPTLPVPQYFYRKSRKQDTPETACTKSDIAMFCLEQTWQAKYFAESAGYHAGKGCFKRLEPHAKVCQVAELKLEEALATFDRDGPSSTEKAALYSAERTKLVGECELCVGRIVPKYNVDSGVSDSEETIACEENLEIFCPKLALRGPLCTACIEKNHKAINTGLIATQQCTSFQIEHFCYDSGLTETTNAAGLETIEGPDGMGLSAAQTDYVRKMVEADVQRAAPALPSSWSISSEPVKVLNQQLKSQEDSSKSLETAPCETELKKFCPALEGRKCTACVKKHLAQINEGVEESTEAMFFSPKWKTGILSTRCSAYQIEHFCYDMGGKIRSEAQSAAFVVKKDVKSRPDQLKSQQDLLLQNIDAEISVETNQVAEAQKKFAKKLAEQKNKAAKPLTMHVSNMYLGCVMLVGILVYAVGLYHEQIQRIDSLPRDREFTDVEEGGDELLGGGDSVNRSSRSPAEAQALGLGDSSGSGVGMAHRRSSAGIGSRLSI